MAKIVIAGAFGGIGSALFRRLAAAEHELYLIGRNADKLNAAQKQFQQVKVTAVADFAEPALIAEKCSCLFEQGPFDALCYCSGISYISSVRKLTYQNSLNLFNINFFALIELLQLLIKHKARHDSCRVAVVSSCASLYGADFGGVYAASKAAVDSFIKSSAKELLKYAISINSVQPAYVDTPLLEIFGRPDDIQQMTKQRQPWGLIDPDDVAAELEYMLTAMPLSVTGSGRLISGGNL